MQMNVNDKISFIDHDHSLVIVYPCDFIPSMKYYVWVILY